MTDPWLIQNTNSCNERVDKAVDPEATTTTGGKKELFVGGEDRKHACLQFEDNFTPTTHSSRIAEQDLADELPPAHSNQEHQPLPDSESYLQGLERKLKKLKKGTKLVEALSEKRQDCLRTLLQENGVQQTATEVLNNNVLLELDAPTINGESTVQEIYRHLQPVQAVTVGETVHIVKYDHLERQRQDADEEDARTPASR